MTAANTMTVETAEARPGSVQRIVSRRPPLPQEVKEIMKAAARYEYELLFKAGWCKNCKREKTDGSRLCPDCKELARKAAEKINRRNGHKSWEQRRAEAANDERSNAAAKGTT